MWISFLFLHKSICCGYSLEVPLRGASNEYPQHMFSWRNKKNTMWIPPLICSYATCVKTAWKKFKELLPVLSSRHLRGHLYSSCVRITMLHACETWPLTKPNLQRLQRNDRAMMNDQKDLQCQVARHYHHQIQ